MIASFKLSRATTSLKALSTNTKYFFYRYFALGGFRCVAKPAYDLLMGFLLMGNRIRDGFVAVDTGDVSSLTLLIKTFERDRSVKRLVSSIRRRYPDIKVIVVNDSKDPIELPGVTNIRMPYDTGASAGRNRAVDVIDTKYLMLLDDDFVFSRRQRLSELIGLMDSHEAIDILGGRVIDLPFYVIHNVQRFVFKSDVTPVTPLDTMFGRCRVVDKTTNFFIGRTEKIRQHRWNDRLKTREHTEFFERARGKLTIAYDEQMLMLHAKTPFDISYMEKRFEFKLDRKPSF